MRDITLHINGTDHALQIEDNWTLLYVLREVLNLTGTKYGCGTNDCGACKVLVDGVPKNSCVLLARNLEGADILTIEGVSHDGHLHPVQQAFVDAGAIQCGYCTPGMVMTSLALLANNPDPSEDEILTALEGNLCRCTGYKKIVEAVQLTARRMREDDGAQQG
ncbi:(2Fe-2S)-binding protein [Pseudoflavonifractor sp. DSM 107456]|uniref:(2Fe-2S)-binding protein n=2 Tax=Pseudoflavonifractor TaxID=1017280 RepID=A0ABR9R9C5_9FIRM|nr:MULTISPECIES: (2Fe-2S)-binding protein [Eubacteriales]MBC5731834.1 (2Fe-2S)-binding protein [Pseudoflavonifractor hominis]MBE5055183.1 (2Fe-2S)-binding protein [Pseudoflavonifractor gallinarum]MBS5136588.1 (2Fe-2S)-binding protein [Oscillospiraceae bacterium]MBT9684986.1 2Fe-2S iron-sulfur cluster binding domain-containing protein [Pseudoflavonifractor sp. MCC625]